MELPTTLLGMVNIPIRSICFYLHMPILPYRDVKLEDTYFNRDVEKAMMAASKATLQQKTQKSLHLANQVGNMYTPSVYGGLVSHLAS